MLKNISHESIVNALSIDVEEYFCANNLNSVAPSNLWDKLPQRVEFATNRLLEILAQYETKATFFILGFVAKKNPTLIRKIAQEGHEIASHGFCHKLAYEQTPAEFGLDVKDSKTLLEDITGQSILGYRAPSFSIVTKNQWAYEIIVNAGYRYDSSVYPTRHPRYGNARANPAPHVIKCGEKPLIVVPVSVSTFKLFSWELRLPVAGGAYWRFFPQSVLLWSLRRINVKEKRPIVSYIHPWELDKDQPVFDTLSIITRIRHYGGISALPDKLAYFLKRFHFRPIYSLIDARFGETWRQE